MLSELSGEGDVEDAGSGLVETAMEISRKRTQMMEQMRKALETGDEKQALSLARVLVGLGQTPPFVRAIPVGYAPYKKKGRSPRAGAPKPASWSDALLREAADGLDLRLVDLEYSQQLRDLQNFLELRAQMA